MVKYRSPVEEIRFIIKEVLGTQELLSLPAFSELTAEVVDAVLEEAAKFVDGKLAPLNVYGDKHPPVYSHAKVTMPAGFIKAYQDFCEYGWNSLSFDSTYGGQQLPWVMAVAVGEMISGANMAFGLCPLLTQGVVELLTKHASEDQKKAYLPLLVSGKWTGTMCLTEPQAGSDLGAIITKATKQEDHYLLEGQKIFITYGEHDLAENIIHMVLARIEGAPKGTKGISLFIVPKVLADGSRNDVKALSLEHKLGIHASPTCVMAFGEKQSCKGYLVGNEHEGLKYMFTMMNNARLAVGVEGIGVAEYALQQAQHYAKERVQMGVTIDKHPDVKRMLLTVSSQVDAMRCLALYIAQAIDMGAHHEDERVRDIYNDVVAFLIPVIKAHATDRGFEHCSTVMQIFGGVGYTEELPVAQAMRDARIAMIYEGANGIQAMDLVVRKLMLHEGRVVEHFIQAMEQGIDLDEYPDIAERWQRFKEVTAIMQEHVRSDLPQAQFLAHYYTKLCGILGGAMMLCLQKEAVESSQILSADHKMAKKESAQFYLTYLLPEVDYLMAVIQPK